MARQDFPPVKAGYLQPQTCQKNTLVHFFLYYNNKFCQILESSERNRWVLPLVGIHLIVQPHLIRVKQIIAVNTHKPVYPDIFSHKMVQCVLGVSLHNSETEEKQTSVNLEIGT